MRLTKRDKQILYFLDEFKVANGLTLEKLFFPSKQAMQRRMKQLYDLREVKREREHCDQSFIYYIKKPKKFRHDLILSDYYREFNNIVKVKQFKKEYRKIEKIRPDGLTTYFYDGKLRIAFVEVEISHKGVSTVVEKYIDLFHSGRWKGILPAFPILILVTDYNVKEKNTPFEIKVVKTNLSDVRRVIE